MLRTALLILLIMVLIVLPGAGIGHAGSGPTTSGEMSARQPSPGQAFAPGQVLVRFKPDTSSRTVASLVAPHGAAPVRRIADGIFILNVPTGQEAQIVSSLGLEPAVEYASLNYRITETPITPLKPITEDTVPTGVILMQQPESCIADLWMSTTQQGERLIENMVSSGTPQVYVFFEYTDCDLEAVRVQVFYLDRDAAPQEVFDEEGTIISGSGIQGVKVQAWPYFDKGTFPVGKYLTIISLSPEGGWDQVNSVSWRVSTFPDDHWFRGISNYQWSLHSTGRRALSEADINMPQAWDITTGSRDLVIAVISTGAVISHPDLKNKTWTNRNEIPDNGIDDDENGCVDDTHGAEFYNGECYPNPTDTVGWGTFSSGIAAAETNNEIGMAGVSWGGRVMPIKVLRIQPDGTLGGFLADMIVAIEYAVSNGARIIHLGPRVEDENVSEELLELLRGTINDAVDQGALVVAGSGDLGEDRLRFPAGFENVVAVGATGLRNERTWFANYGPGIDLVAPGELILSTCGSGQYCIGSGTSLATAHVDGVAALIWSVNPDLTPAEVRAILQESADDLGPDGYDEQYGHGKLNAAAALELTPHRLYVYTASLDDRLTLAFLLDDQVMRACQRVWNPWTGPQTWTLSSDSEWFAIEDSDGLMTAPVPSSIRVCADGSALVGFGTFEATLEARSTLPRHEGPVHINVTTVYQPRLPRVFLGLIQRP